MENNYKALAMICFISAIVLAIASSFLTANFFYSSGNGGFWGWVLIAIGITFDAGKFLFPAISSYHYEKSHIGRAVGYGFLCLVCLLISFGASQAMDMNKSNEILNDTVTTSSAYQRQNEIFSTTSDSIKKLKADIANLKQNKQAEIQSSTSGLRNQKDSLPRDYITKRNQIQSRIDSTANKTKLNIEKQIQDKEKELKLKESSLLSTNKGFETVGNNVRPTKGMYALASWMCPSNPVMVMGWMNTVKNFLIEILAIAFSLAFGSLIGQNTHFKLPKFSPGLKDKSSLSPTTAKAGFDIKNCVSDNKPQSTCIQASTSNLMEAVRAYAVEALSSINPDNSCDGVTKISKRVEDYTRTELLKAKNYLEQKKVLEVKGNTTYISDISKLKKYV